MKKRPLLPSNLAENDDSPATVGTTTSQKSRRQFTMGALAGVSGAFILAACGKDDGTGSNNTSGVGTGSSEDSSSGQNDSGSDGSTTTSTSSSSSNGNTSTSEADSTSEDSTSESSASTGETSSTSDDSTSDDSTTDSGDSSDSSTDSTSSTDTTTDGTDTEIPGQCTIYPEQQEGPYYDNRPPQVRADITEGLDGTPLGVEIRLVAADGCTPIADTDIDIWHADARGVYSEYPNMLGGVDASNDTFLRGRQKTDKYGWVRFTSIYPGWYPGRTTHIHFKVIMPGMQEVISQMYFPEDLSAEIYSSGPYAAHGQKDTSNAGDGVIQQDSGGIVPPLADMTKKGSGYVAKLLVTVANR